jgi:hypothetical protein
VPKKTREKTLTKFAAAPVHAPLSIGPSTMIQVQGAARLPIVAFTIRELVLLTSCLDRPARDGIKPADQQLFEGAELDRRHPNRLLKHPPMHAFDTGWFRHGAFVAKVVLLYTDGWLVGP